MAVPVRSRRFFGPTVLAAGATTAIYTVPTGRTAIVHALWIANLGIAAAFIDLRLNGTTAPARIYIASIPATSTVDLYDRLILNPGDVLHATAAVGSTLTVSAFGSLLMGEPS